MQPLKELLLEQKRFFASQETKKVSFRISQLKQLKQLIIDYEQEIINALKSDLNKSELDAYTTEIGILLKDISYTIKHLPSWSKPKKVKTPITHFGAKSYIHYEPYGAVLIIAPWNYPFQLAIAPLIGALAAGNCAIIKPSEFTPATSELLAKIINQNFRPEYIHVVEGGKETSQLLLEEKFDYIFFTGSVPVGKKVMEAAAKHLTPVTLELGGKSPCIVHKDAKLEVAAKRVIWGKFLNAGQTCIAPDYLLVHKNIRNELIEQMKRAIVDLYTENPLENSDYTRVVNEHHFNRLLGYLSDGQIDDGQIDDGQVSDGRINRQIAVGGKSNRETLQIEPTLLVDVNWTDPVMDDEIFGPILPIIEYEDISEFIIRIEERPKPLAMYIFSEDKTFQRDIVQRLSFGGGCINDTIYHVASPYLPFGGVGESGVGSYHGEDSFLTFSHRKSILKQTTLFDLPIRYPNYKHALKLVKKFLR
ncbi:aldehyde dehydrogenase [Desulfuribacillus alkaliarsenatis]|uniref:Aldehyde dehydrogenase n=1 Tax=Desulfuribacillus alkaliarsenatis TaxID=766136 RepID=A0A1E5G3F7_9FIRM|nr:aldehyde dehydrogenase [Desulfuribacillus alkaliarsenatis]